MSEASAMLCWQRSFNELQQQLGGVMEGRGVYIACSAVIIPAAGNVHQKNSICQELQIGESGNKVCILMDLITTDE